MIASRRRTEPLLGLLLSLVLLAAIPPSPGFARRAPASGAGAPESAWQIDRRSRPRPWPPLEPTAGTGHGRVDLPRSTALMSLADAVSIDTMMACLDTISTGLQTRYFRTTGMQRATEYAFDRLSSAGCDNVYFDNFTYSGYAIRNVVGVKTGTSYPSRIYMICGHLDSTSPQRDTLAPGAEDNGSGAIGVLEAARLLAGIPTEATIYFVCFTAEEQGLVGSDHLASIAQQQHWDLRGVLNMDMVGYDTPGDPALWIEGFHGNAGSVALMDLLESVANAYTGLEVYRYPGEGWGSDHESFNTHGFSAILAIDYNWEEYACYHQTCDVISNIVPSQFRQMIVAVTVAGAQLAGLRTSLGGIDGTADRGDSDDDSGILVEIPGTGYDPVLTGPGGSFAIPDLLPGRYTLRASAQGYVNAEVHVTVLDGQFTHVALHLDPAVAGEVRGVVALQGGGIPIGARVFAEGQTGVANAALSGSYDLAPVLPGRNVISANAPSRMPGVRVVDVPSGGVVSGIDFNLEPSWTFEGQSEGFVANAGWQWGNDSQSGAHSGANVWGTKLGSNYDTCADYRLDLPAFDLRFYTTARLHFWQWYKTEAVHDGGNVQVSTDAGTTWTVLPPVGGYPSQMSGACNPLSGQPGYGGTQSTWSEAIFDLAPFAGRSIRLRLWFGADGATTNRGWYVDDFYLEGSQLPSDVAQTEPDRPLSGVSLVPNPFSSSVAVRFRVHEPTRASVTVFDASGRRIRTILENGPIPAGEQRLEWNGSGEDGRPLPAGFYWVRIFTSAGTEIRPVTLVK